MVRQRRSLEMRIWIPVAAALFAVLLSACAGLAYPRDDAAVVDVKILSRDDIHRLNDLGMDIMNVRDGVAEIAAVPSEIDVLWANGFRPVVTVPNMRDQTLSFRLADRGVYHDYADITADLAAWAAAYPLIAEVVSIGQSVQHREIWALKITDNPDIQEHEPEIQWIGGHHGDETIGIEVCYYMAEYLLENYGYDSQVTWLVDNREIWIIPMLNPDGHENGSRYNAQGTDLNRNYLCPGGCNSGTAFSAPETRALRDFNVGMNPVTSLTFHAGAVYVNYLWDYSYAATPDEPMIITISNGYGQLSGLPVTNGADWYVAHGTCQDWCYETRGEIDTTIEVSTVKNPPSSQIDGIVADNIPAMLYQARHSGHGIRGLVTDGETGEPLYATISIPEIGKDVYTDPDVGDYHRMVEAGTYTVIATVEGYPTETVENVSASLDTFVVVDFAMEPPPRGTVAGYVTDDSSNPIAATVELTDFSGYSSTADPGTGYYEILFVPAGSHDVKAYLTGYLTVEHEGVLVEDNTISSEDFELAAAIAFDDLESGLTGWTGAWGLTTTQSHSPSSSMTDSPSGNYTDYAHTVVTLSNSIDLSSAESADLSFWHRYDTETGYDFCIVEVSDDGGSSWTEVASYSGLQTDWAEILIDITEYAGTDGFKVRFILDSDGWVTRDGWYVDDVAIFAETSASGIDDGGEVRRLSVTNYPNPFNPKTSIRYALPAAGPVALRIYDAAGRLVRTLIESETTAAGSHETRWDGTDSQGRGVAAGIYFARIEVGGREASGKLVLLK
jgi:hypothetical protein